MVQQGQYQSINTTINQFSGTLNVYGASLGVFGPVIANIPAGTRIISIQCPMDTYVRVVALYSNFKVALVLVDIDGRLWSISSPSEVSESRDSKLHAAQIDIFAGVSKSQYLSPQSTYRNFQSTKPTGFRSDSIMQIRFGIVQTFDETRSVDFTFGGATIVSM